FEAISSRKSRAARFERHAQRQASAVRAFRAPLCGRATSRVVRRMKRCARANASKSMVGWYRWIASTEACTTAMGGLQIARARHAQAESYARRHATSESAAMHHE